MGFFDKTDVCSEQQQASDNVDLLFQYLQKDFFDTNSIPTFLQNILEFIQGHVLSDADVVRAAAAINEGLRKHQGIAAQKMLLVARSNLAIASDMRLFKQSLEHISRDNEADVLAVAVALLATLREHPLWLDTAHNGSNMSDFLGLIFCAVQAKKLDQALWKDFAAEALSASETELFLETLLLVCQNPATNLSEILAQKSESILPKDLPRCLSMLDYLAEQPSDSSKKNMLTQFKESLFSVERRQNLF